MAISIWNRWLRCLRWWQSYNLPSGWLQLDRLRRTLWLVVILHLLGTDTPDTTAFALDLPSPPAVVGQATTLLLAVGDIADCRADNAHHTQTSALVDSLPGTVAILGDIAYPSGSPENFSECYDPAWGQHNARIRPAPGNHEYRTDGAGGYFAYFGAAASPLEPDCILDCKGYYSYDLGDWHIVALNSENDMAAGSEQEQWLRADLAAHRSPCALADRHHPRFSSGVHGNNARSADVWQALYEAGVDVVLNGHDHNYERFAPQNPNGELDTDRGIREFVVGTGGVPLRTFGVVRANSQVRNNQAWGVLQLSLSLDRYAWEFRPIAGQEFVESGSAFCVRVAGDWKSKVYLPLLYEQPSVN